MYPILCPETRVPHSQHKQDRRMGPNGFSKFLFQDSLDTYIESMGPQYYLLSQL